MSYILLISILISFLMSFLFIPYWIKKCKSIGLVWEDVNKFGGGKNAASSGGIVVIMAFILGVLSYVALKTFVFEGTIRALEIFSLLSVILIFGIIGLVDDLLGWKNGGLSNKLRLLLAFVASIPLVVISAGVHSINLPLLGFIDLGILYPLVLIPLGVAGASTTFNFLAGFNGLEAGQGILILSFLSFVSYSTGSPWLGIIGLCMVGALLGFYLFNKFPAKVFPGDTMTYSIGALIAGMAILGNFEKIAIIVFIPYIIEVILKVRGKLEKHSFAKVDSRGNLKMPYSKIYGLEHLAILILDIFGTVTEKKIVYFIYLIQIIFILIGFSML